MKRWLISFTGAFALTAPAYATGGMTCRTAGASPIVGSVGFGHAAGATLLQDASRLTVGGRNVPVTAPQWWLDRRELRLLLTDPQSQRVEAIIKTTRKGHAYDGNLWRGGKRFWVRCQEE